MIEDEIKLDLHTLLKRNPIVYKYTSFDNGFELLRRNRIFFKCPIVFNDPYDCYSGLVQFVDIPEDYREHIYNKFHSLMSENEKLTFNENRHKISDEQLKEFFSKSALPLVLSKYGVTCFSKTYRNLLMWSHYAESHNGICVGFDLNKLYIELRKMVPESTILCVKYVQKFEAQNYFKDNFAVLNCMRIKSSHWRYEKEVRITISPINFDNSNSFPLPFGSESLASIYLGSKMEKSNADKILAICNENYPASRKYKIELNRSNFRLQTKQMNMLSR